MEQFITTLGGVLVALLSFLGILANNRRDTTTTSIKSMTEVIEEYREINKRLKEDYSELKKENEDLESVIEGLRKRIVELEVEVGKLKGGN